MSRHVFKTRKACCIGKKPFGTTEVVIEQVHPLKMDLCGFGFLVNLSLRESHWIYLPHDLIRIAQKISKMTMPSGPVNISDEIRLIFAVSERFCVFVLMTLRMAFLSIYASFPSVLVVAGPPKIAELV